MKKFFAAIVMVCLIGAFSNQAMAQGPHRDNGRPGQAPAAVHQPAPAQGHHVNPAPAPRPAAQPAPRHAQPAPPPPAPRHAKPAPPPPAPHHARPLPPPEPVPPAPRPAVDYRPDGGLYIGIGPIGIRIPL
ncbi:MAG: hypothetical protein IJF84_05305 [Thermoguttaceae bacterium]|nr:hypothetical protein [Thermoguttaceae bacterium]